MRKTFTIFATVALFALIALVGTATAAQGRLSYAKAKHAIQRKADRFARTHTRITSMFRLNDVMWSARAEWKHINPSGCSECGYDPNTGSFYDTPTTESCSTALLAKQLRSGRVRVSTENFACY